MQQRQIGGAAAEAVAFRTAAAPSSWAGPRATHYTNRYNVYCAARGARAPRKRPERVRLPV